MTRRFAVAAALVASLAVVAAGCGGSSGSSESTPAVDWAGDFCSAITTWTTSLTDSVDTLRNGDVSKDSLQSVAGDAKSSTETLIDDLRGLGTPDTSSGEDAKSTLDDLADDLQGDVDDIETAVNEGSASMIGTVTTVTNTLVTMGNQLTTALTKLQQLDANGELEDAFNEADSCKDLTG
jgi:hypothetical protein